MDRNRDAPELTRGGDISDTHHFAEGSFRWVRKGKYTKGARAGQECVSKVFKERTVMSETFFEKDIEAVDKTL